MVPAPLRQLAAEVALFRAQPHDFRILSLTNMTYALATPVIDIFVAAYIMRASHEPAKVVVYQLAIYTGIPLTFLLNGWLLRHFAVKTLFSAGMLLSGLAMLAMMSLGTLSIAGIGGTGLLMGASFGFYWANRDTVAVAVTADGNRNYYYGLDTFAYTLTSLAVPLAVGWFLHAHGAGDHVRHAYLAVVGASVGVTLAATLICARGRFPDPSLTPFLHRHWHPLWTAMLRMAVLKGLGQGFLVTAPSMLVMTLVGDERALGIVQMAGGLAAAAAMYLVGRATRPDNRLHVLAVGLTLFLLAAIANAALFDAAGVIVFMMLLLLSRPLMDQAYYPIQFRVIDLVSRLEDRSEFSYILIHELGLYAGRLGGSFIFLGIDYGLSSMIALRFAILFIALIQLPTLVLARGIVRRGLSLTPPD